MSPDNTSDGWLRKKWAIADGKRCLIKGGSGALQQEPYNEVLASRLMERLGIPHVAYTLLEQDGYPYSVCDNFITPETELVTGRYVMQTRQKPNRVSVYRHYVNCCEELGVSGIVDALNRMIVADFLIANEDRHQNNFGVVRNAETLEWTCRPNLRDPALPDFGRIIAAPMCRKIPLTAAPPPKMTGKRTDKRERRYTRADRRHNQAAGADAAAIHQP